MKITIVNIFIYFLSYLYVHIYSKYTFSFYRIRIILVFATYLFPLNVFKEHLPMLLNSLWKHSLRSMYNNLYIHRYPLLPQSRVFL